MRKTVTPFCILTPLPWKNVVRTGLLCSGPLLVSATTRTFTRTSSAAFFAAVHDASYNADETGETEHHSRRDDKK